MRQNLCEAGTHPNQVPHQEGQVQRQLQGGQMGKREEELNRFSDECIKIIEEGVTKLSTLPKNNPFPAMKWLRHMYN